MCSLGVPATCAAVQASHEREQESQSQTSMLMELERSSPMGGMERTAVLQPGGSTPMMAFML